MARKDDSPDPKELKAALEDVLAALRAEPPRLKTLLRDGAGLVDQVVSLLEETKHDDLAGKAGRISKALRGAAILPAAMSIPLIRGQLEKLLASLR